MNDAFREQVAGLPAQFEHEPSPVGGVLPPKGRLLVGGLGGSGLAGEFLAQKQRESMDVVVVRDEFLPRRLGPDDALLAVSYSGNTSETLSLWREAGERGRPRAAVASGARCSRTPVPPAFLTVRSPTDWLRVRLWDTYSARPGR